MKHEKRKILVFGAQGSGKGTQAELLSRRCNFMYISTGDIFRREIKDKTDLGKKAFEHINKGHLVPDEITNEMVAKHLSEEKSMDNGFVLDGYPRNAGQMEHLNSVIEITDAIEIEISDDEAISRLSGRLACHCGLSYHIKHNPPKKINTCDRCGQQLFIREDDTPDAIKKRLAIFHEQTKVLFAHYQNAGVMKKVDGQRPIEEVFVDIVKLLNLKHCRMTD